MIEWRKIVVRMEKFLVKVEKNIVFFWQDWSCYLEAVTRGLWSGHKPVTRNVHYVACSASKCDFGAENVAQ